MSQLVAISSSAVPALVAAAGERAGLRFLEFFAANIRNPHMRRAYARVEIPRTSEPNAIGTVRVPVSIQISDRKIMARWARRCSRPRDDGRVFDFSHRATILRSRNR